MTEFRVKKGPLPFKDIRPDEWTTEQFCSYYLSEFKRRYGIETRRPIGQLKCHINQKTVGRLFRMEGRSISVHPNVLYKEFMDWMFERKNVNNLRVWYFSKEEIMADFLDERAKKKLDTEVGSFDDLKQFEEKRIEAAKHFFGENWKEKI